MTASEPTKLFRSVNQSIGQQPSLGPIPANLLAPSGAILVSFYLLVEIILSLGFAPFLLLSAWGVSTWWIVVGEKTWTFAHKFASIPEWKRGHLPYQPLLGQEDE
ncbi:MAG: hypothetical protein MJA27_22615 [Pseudanabaenales cyanobacterium]|nr:hypothetical protein [Pseudanabaenales cyanobacterium]